ncbi:MAG TPA: hypothetical protein VI893_04705 [Thermoplasmata archaeon]|nr:hypothetical protein [Thermoplasmata archaeon]
MAAELLFLSLASSMDRIWGMAVGGGLMRLMTGESGVHYPTSYIMLPQAFSILENFLTLFAGSFLIPLGLIRIQAPKFRTPATGPLAVGRARTAYLPTFASVALNLLLVLGLAAVFPLGPSRWIHSFVPGVLGDFLSWTTLVILSYAVAAIVVYVPVRAVEDRSNFRYAFLGGVREGLKRLGPTLCLLILLAWPTFLLLAPVQIRPLTLVRKFRPELITILLAAVAILGSFINYLIYSAVARLHWLDKEREA